MIKVTRFGGDKANVTFALLMFAAVFWALPCRAQERRPLKGQVPKAVANGTVRSLGRYPGTAHLDVAIGLPLGDRAGLKSFIDALYDPKSPNYKNYLTPGQFTERFGASAADYQKVVDFVKAAGLTVTATTPNRMIVDVSGTVADYERAFHFTMNTYQHPTESRQFRGPDVEPSVPADVPIQDLMGLDDYMTPRRMSAQQPVTEPHKDATGSGPGGSFTAKDLRAAYVPGVTLTGTGQSIGLFELGAYSADDVAAYLQYNGLKSVPLVNILLNGFSGIWTSAYGDGEESLDIEMAIAMAPGVSQILVYEGTNGGDVMNRMATDNTAKQLSCSWGFLPAPATMQQILMEYAAQGQSFFHASGDGGTWTGPINAPGGDPYTTEVGGTDLVTNGPGGAWMSETAWSGSGGGVDTDYAIPSYQATVSMTANKGSTTYRNFPDVAIVGQPSIYAFGGGHSSTSGGTSASAPLWASFMALANQQAAAQGKPPIGFLNPTIYALGQASRYTADMHDITVGDNTNANSPNLYYAVPGFDLTSGWGTPNGLNLINDLAASGSGTPGFSLSAGPYQISVAPGGSGTITLTITPFNNFSDMANLSVSGLPSGVTASFSPPSTSTSSVLTLSIGASVAPGSYVATVSANSGIAIQTIAVGLTVVAPVAADFTLSASPSILSVLPGASVQTSITITPAGSFAGSVNLSLTGAPSDLTASFAPMGTSGSKLTLSAGSGVTPGTYVIGVSGSSGALSHTTSIGVEVLTSGLSPVPIDLSTSYNITGIAPDGAPFLVGIQRCCAYSANLLGTSLTTTQSVPFIFGPSSNGLTPPYNAVSAGSGSLLVPLPSGIFGSIQVLASGKNGNQLAETFQLDYANGSSSKFTQSVSDWNTPQSYTGETIVKTMSYSDTSTGSKTSTTAYLYAYSFDLDCKTVSDFSLPDDGNVQTLALTVIPTSTPCTGSVNMVSGSGAAISQNAWIEIHGVNLAPSSVPATGMTWSNAPEFAQGEMPTQLNGVGVTVNGVPAYVYYISPSQIDVLTPPGASTGMVPVVVTVGSTTTAAFSVNTAAVSPAFALAGGTNYLAATHANGSYIGSASEGPLFTPATPGEEIVLYGFGFGLPTGGVVAGSSSQSGTLPAMPIIKIGGETAQVAFAGLISPGLYQFNVVVPSNATSGNDTVTATFNNVAISTAGVIPVQGSN